VETIEATGSHAKKGRTASQIRASGDHQCHPVFDSHWLGLASVTHDLPPWRLVFHYFSAWRRDGTWTQIHDALHKQVRLAAGREAEPSAAILDSQSVKTTEKGGPMDMMPARKSTAANATCW
jgi:transposase